MRARIGTLSRRLAKAEASTLTEDGELRGGVMLVPPILGLDEWERQAMPMLAALAHAARDDIERTEAAHRKPMPDARNLPPLPPGGMVR